MIIQKLDIRLARRRFLWWRAAALAAVAAAVCSNSRGPLVAPAAPPVVFRGWINGTYYELEGNWPTQPNTCELWGDTIRVFLYSDDYTASPIPSGCHLRLDIHPFVRGPLDTMPITFLATKWTMLHAVLHTQGITQSYLITPRDTMYRDRYVQAEIGAVSRSHGGRLLLEEFFAQAPPITGTNARQRLSIEKAVIAGHVQ